MINRRYVLILCLSSVAAPCRSLSAQPGEGAAVVASCPARPGKDIGVVRIKLIPGGKELTQTDGDDISIDWTLPPLRNGQTAELNCGYVRKGSNSINIPAGGWVSVPVPATAKTCTFSQHDPNKATCSR